MWSGVEETEVTIFDSRYDGITPFNSLVTRRSGMPCRMMSIGITQEERVRVREIEEGSEVKFIVRRVKRRRNIKVECV
jgi:hypothetical protein